MLIYILKTTACLAILLIFYKLFLEKENMHVFKRFYLLGALLFALIVPTIVFTEYVVVDPSIYEVAQNTKPALITEPNIAPALEADVTDIAPLLWIIYFMGMFFFGIKFLRNLFQIFRRIRKNPKYKNSNFIQVLLQEKIPPHTFFKYIFLNKTKFESNEIPKEVILHEETHARQKHSLDVVFIELLQVLFWVNPLVYFFKRAIKLNHEFLADSAVLNKDVDTVTYQNTLLSFLSSESAKKYQPTLPNAINYSSIKKRFTIMKSKTSKKSIFFRSLLLLPLLALLLVGFTETKLIEVVSEEETSLVEKTLTGETVQILINSKGQLLIKNELVTLEDFDSFLLKLNENLSKGNRGEIIRAQIIIEEKSPSKVITDVEIILNEYGVTQIDVLGPETMSLTSPSQEGATKEQLAEYNALAKKYNAIDIEQRKIPGFELTVLELAYRNMNPEQKKLAQPFPECLPQEGAMKVQLQEYNTLAKRYNTMIEKEENIWIKKGDVERLEYLHSLMSEEQKVNAEPFPDFPEPPEPPMPPNYPDEEEIIEIEREMASQERAMEEQEVAMLEEEHAMKEQEIEMERQVQKMEEQEIETERRAGKLLQPPPPPAPESPLDHVIKMAKKNATFYFEGKKISSDKAIEIIKNNDEINIHSTGSKSKRPKVKLSTAPIVVD